MVWLLDEIRLRCSGIYEQTRDDTPQPKNIDIRAPGAEEPPTKGSINKDDDESVIYEMFISEMNALYLENLSWTTVESYGYCLSHAISDEYSFWDWNIICYVCGASNNTNCVKQKKKRKIRVEVEIFTTCFSRYLSWLSLGHRNFNG